MTTEGLAAAALAALWAIIATAPRKARLRDQGFPASRKRSGPNRGADNRRRRLKA